MCKGNFLISPLFRTDLSFQSSIQAKKPSFSFGINAVTVTNRWGVTLSLCNLARVSVFKAPYVSGPLFSYKQGEHLLPCSRAGIFQLQRFTVFPHSKVYGGLFHLDLLKVHAYRERNFVNKFVC